jgi:thiamine biosynthesis protein ThiI
MKLSFVFFHAYPYVGDEVKDKIYGLMRLLAPYQQEALLTIFPFGDIQAAISKECVDSRREQYRTLLFRRLMVEAGNLLAKKIDALVLVTGDSLGQVSSQTIHNISYLDRATAIPIFRPLIGLNKSEIVSYAKQIGTYETSLIPHDDACALFAPKHPIIKPDWNFWESFDGRHDLQDLLKKGLDNAQHWLWMPDGRSKILN